MEKLAPGQSASAEKLDPKLPQPEGRQWEVLYLPASGHTVVLGTAGSGKTTLAIHRARYLAQFAPPTDRGRTLLVTYGKMLTTYLETISSKNWANIDVRTYHRFARGYLANSPRGFPDQHAILEKTERTSVTAWAIQRAQHRFPDWAVLQHPVAAIDEEFSWIARMGIQSLDAYAVASRTGRGGMRVPTAERPALWDAYEYYKERRADRGYLYDWDDIAQAVLEELQADDRERYYRHVVIDEGQDFSPVMLRSLVAAVPPGAGGSITYFGDGAQQIYGGRISWRDAGLKIRKEWRFEENYRNTQQIAALARSLALSPVFRIDADIVAPKSPKAAGQKPALVACASPSAEREFVIEQAIAAGSTRRVGILLRNRTSEDWYRKQLKTRGLSVQRLHRDSPWRGAPCVWVGTYHAAKGLEFDTVILPGLDDETVPDQRRIEAIGDKDLALGEEARLVYVAMTRARTVLIMSYAGKLTSLLAGITWQLCDRSSYP